MRLRYVFVVSLGMGTLTGCCTPAGCRSAYLGRPAPCDRCAAATQMAPVVVPAPLPANPIPVNPIPVNPVPVAPPVQSNFVPPSNPDPPFGRFNPDAGSHLYPPLPVNPAPPDNPNEAGARLGPPQFLPAQPKNTDQPPVDKPNTDEPPTYPADIPDFAIVQKGVANGKQPFPEGVKWLKEHGYKTVLHVRLPNKTDNAAKNIFESRGIGYLDLAVSPQTLNKDVVERFNQIVADDKNRPLFVFDEGGDLAGALWYLHFRTAEGMSDEKARAEASRLGFKQDKEGSHREMWIAVQNYLKNQNP